MPEDTRRDERLEEIHAKAPVFPVAPVRSRSHVPSVALVALVVGILAFVAGIGVASSGPAGRAAGPNATPGASGVAAASTGAMPAAASPGVPSTPGGSLGPSGSSVFADAFEPGRVIAATPGGADCAAGEPSDKEVPRTRRDGPRLTFQRSWMIWCPIPEGRRQALLVKTFEALAARIPAETYGYSTARDGTADALFPYAQYPLAGTVAVTAGAAGDGLAIAVVLEEWRPDEVR